jgi:hypothetical protein
MWTLEWRFISVEVYYTYSVVHHCAIHGTFKCQELRAPNRRRNLRHDRRLPITHAPHPVRTLAKVYTEDYCIRPLSGYGAARFPHAAESPSRPCISVCRGTISQVVPNCNSKYNAPGTGLSRYLGICLNPNDSYSSIASCMEGTVSSLIRP